MSKFQDVSRTPPTRKYFEAATFNNACFFCEEKENLHAVTSLSFDESIRKMATQLEDSKLIAKLAAGDMVATEALYHKSCVTKLWNSYQSCTNGQDKDNESSGKISSTGNALDSVVNWLRDTIAISLDGNTVPVFLLKDLF